MSKKLISANDVLKYTVLAGEIRNQYMEVVPAYYVREAPAVDAVEVVRCRDCFRANQYDDGSDNFVCSLGGTKKGSGFCSEGERKEDEVD